LFSPGTPASSTIKTDRHDIAEILLKMALKHQKPYKIMKPFFLIILGNVEGNHTSNKIHKLITQF